MATKKKTSNPIVELLLCIFLGYFGAHRFYAGKKKSACLYLFTFGVFTLGWIFDIIVISIRCIQLSKKSPVDASHAAPPPDTSSKRFTIPNRYVVFDIETTGFSRSDDRIIEVAANEYVNGILTNQFQSYINPGRHIPNAITRLTGISDNDVAEAPTIDQAKADILSFFGSTTLVGHNINTFDIPFLEAQLKCHFKNERIDTLPLARNAFPGLPNYKLFTLDQVLELGGVEHHRAANDITVNNALLIACSSPQKYKHRIANPDVLNSIIIEERPSLYPTIDIHSITPTDPANIPNTPITGHGIAFSGEFSRLPEEMYQIAVDAGGILKNQVSKKVDYLVLGLVDERFLDENGMSNKQRTATKLSAEGHNIKIISESEFMELVGK